MIGASEGLYNYFNQNIREEGQEIEIKITKGAKSYTITDDDLVASSVKIIKKSVSGASFDIGECYVDSATFTINKNINNYKSLTGAKVTIRIKVNNTDLSLSENVLLGTFRILQDGIKRTNTLLQVTADSYISKFDKSRKRATFTGDLYDLVTDSCSKCKVTFGMTESAFRALSPNVAKTYEIKKDSSLKTHRDVIMYVSQLIGGFATTTPAGALIFKNYTSNNDVCNVNDNVIVNYSIGDEVYNLSGLGMSIKEKDVYLYREGEDDDSPYFLNLDTNPIIENCTDEEITAIVGNMWNKLIELNLNNFSFEFNGNPLIEVGDIISIPERSLETYVASCEWTYHGKEKISCVSVDKNKRTETQREKQNENKPSNASKDDRVDDLIKKTTTGTKKVKKTHTDTYSINLNNELMSTALHLPEYVWTEPKDTGSGGTSLSFHVGLLSPLFWNQFFYDNIISKLPITPANDDIITVDLSNLRNYIVIGYIKNGYSDIDASASLSFKPLPDGSISTNSINSSTLKSKIYNLDALYGVIDELPYFYFSNKSTNSGKTSSTVEIIHKMYLDLNIKINIDTLQNIFTYESFENGILKVKYKDLVNYDSLLSNFNLSNLFTASYNGYVHFIKYDSQQVTVDKITNIEDLQYKELGCAIATTRSDIDDEINNLTSPSKTCSITVKYDTYENESYSVTIEGTGDKINDTDKKAEDNKSEIEKLNTAVSNLKTKVKTNTAQIKSLVTKVGLHDNTISEIREDEARLDQRVTKLERGSSGGMTDAQKKQLEQNTKDISTLKTTVSNNTRNISTNTANISTLKTDVANNTKNISTNTTSIANLTTRVTNLENSGGSGGSGSEITEAERQQIQTNKTDIANLTTRVTNLENSGGSGGSGSGITEAERQQIQTNKTNIENLTLTVNGHTTSIEDILRRLAVLEKGGSEGGGETGDVFKFKSLNLNLASDNDFTFPSFNLNNYYFNNIYYLSNDGSRSFKMTVELTKPNTKQTFREFYNTDGSQYYIIGTADTESLESSGNIRFTSYNRYSYLDCISKYEEQQIISQPIKIYNYEHLRVTESRSNWLNTTTGNLVKTDNGAHIGDTISIPITYKYGFKAVNAENKPDSLNKYYYMINTTGNKESGNIVDWTEINAEPNVETKINFTYNVTGDGARFYLYVSDGQFTFNQDDYYITKLT